MLYKIAMACVHWLALVSWTFMAIYQMAILSVKTKQMVHITILFPLTIRYRLCQLGGRVDVLAA